MKPSITKSSSQANELLAFLLWSAEKLARPTFRNITETFEQWDYRTRLRHQLRRWEQQQWLERSTETDRVIYRLTEGGRLAALGGCDPSTRWNRAWDGQWRMVLFDLPTHRQSTRIKLLRWLRDHQFGYLQQSVWITPDPIRELQGAFQDLGEDVESLILIEGRGYLQGSDARIVAGAWDFPEMNNRYEEYLQLLASCDLHQKTGADRSKLQSWLRREQQAWKHALKMDPLLPAALLPQGYLGPKAWRAKLALFSETKK